MQQPARYWQWSAPPGRDKFFRAVFPRQPLSTHRRAFVGSNLVGSSSGIRSDPAEIPSPEVSPSVDRDNL
ncbi:hypothetical protein AND_001852 [Anopheles darlingi]|uniref:Uncharacterized protein n=1 Tax=Anopheles darlingi TaxID=43151 RepID=W5JPP7_ANODA|nr:hypothetical protein AND_001852 [Anopheles darlingi]